MMTWPREGAGASGEGEVAAYPAVAAPDSYHAPTRTHAVKLKARAFQPPRGCAGSCSVPTMSPLCLEGRGAGPSNMPKNQEK